MKLLHILPFKSLFFLLIYVLPTMSCIPLKSDLWVGQKLWLGRQKNPHSKFYQESQRCPQVIQTYILQKAKAYKAKVHSSPGTEELSICVTWGSWVARSWLILFLWTALLIQIESRQWAMWFFKCDFREEGLVIGESFSLKTWTLKSWN